jgi:hypothetical protein
MTAIGSLRLVRIEEVNDHGLDRNQPGWVRICRE